eukprot:c4700_g1_i1.p1 GENE.c4700_g1_i1~~c4700_g1_i1.p1  ORF type:complete len:166 (-),score=58.12 c4700_g1_i1:13-510(-)
MSALLAYSYCPVYGPTFGFFGACVALTFSCLGAAYGTAKSGVGISEMGIKHPEHLMKSIIPVVMAGVRGIYGLNVAAMISARMGNVDEGYSLFNGYAHLSAGFACGLANLAAGFAVGIVGDVGVRASAQQGRIYVAMVLILIFAEALGLYGLILAIVLQSKQAGC